MAHAAPVVPPVPCRTRSLQQSPPSRTFQESGPSGASQPSPPGRTSQKSAPERIFHRSDSGRTFRRSAPSSIFRVVVDLPPCQPGPGSPTKTKSGPGSGNRIRSWLADDGWNRPWAAEEGRMRPQVVQPQQRAGTGVRTPAWGIPYEGCGALFTPRRPSHTKARRRLRRAVASCWETVQQRCRSEFGRMAAGDRLRVAVSAGSTGGALGRKRSLGDVASDRGPPGSPAT